MIVIKKAEERRHEITIQLSNGEEAGTGYGYTKESAIYWAIQDCLKSEDSRHHTIGNFYKRMYYPE